MINYAYKAVIGWLFLQPGQTAINQHNTYLNHWTIEDMIQMCGESKVLNQTILNLFVRDKLLATPVSTKEILNK